MPPICARHEIYFVWLGTRLVCPACESSYASEWRDEEADVNDYTVRPISPEFAEQAKTVETLLNSGAFPRPEHIYPRLHGTGGIGPGTWQRGALAAAQEGKAQDKHLLASAIVLLATEDILYALVHPGSESRVFDTLADKIAKLL